jgi:hypothetical protein
VKIITLFLVLGECVLPGDGLLAAPRAEEVQLLPDFLAQRPEP